MSIKTKLILKISILMVLIGLFIFFFNYTFVQVEGISMEPTYTDGEILLFSKHNNDIERFDTVIVNIDNKYLIKRVIGLPGEKVVYKDNILFINDKVVNDAYNTKTEDFTIENSNDGYVVLGDNRENSADSRKYGSFNFIYAVRKN